jgi:3D (Asp-Asp-Asp) domain-containing protein
MLPMSTLGHTYYDLGPIISYPTEIRSEVLVGTERYSFVAEVTAYTASNDECGKHDGITASGTQATEGRTIAVPSWIPFGTIVTINGHEYVAEDHGGDIQNNRIDIYMDNKRNANEFGRKYVEVSYDIR